MSRIFSLKCEHCSELESSYSSFGHPTATFTYYWNCQKCGHENKVLVEAWPHGSKIPKTESEKRKFKVYSEKKSRELSNKINKIIEETKKEE